MYNKATIAVSYKQAKMEDDTFVEKTKKLVIIGTGEFAQIAYEYFTFDSKYEVVGFAVEREFKKEEELFGLPVIEFEDISKHYSPSEYEVFVAITYTKLNRVRKRLYKNCKESGYKCATYISSRAFVWHNVEIGDNSFIFEDNTIQFHAKVGNDVILWSGNHIGHRSEIGDHCWITSHVVVSGFCSIGSGCFLGVNATIGDRVQIADDIVLAAGALTVKNLDEKGRVYIGAPARLMEGRTAYSQFDVQEGEK